jgi:hypothetical protein
MVAMNETQTLADLITESRWRDIPATSRPLP